MTCNLRHPMSLRHPVVTNSTHDTHMWIWCDMSHTWRYYHINTQSLLICVTWCSHELHAWYTYVNSMSHVTQDSSTSTRTAVWYEWLDVVTNSTHDTYVDLMGVYMFVCLHVYMYVGMCACMYVRVFVFNDLDLMSHVTHMKVRAHQDAEPFDMCDMTSSWVEFVTHVQHVWRLTC